MIRPSHLGVRHGVGAATALTLALPLTSCAVGEDPATSSPARGSALAPTFAPERGGHHRRHHAAGHGSESARPPEAAPQDGRAPGPVGSTAASSPSASPAADGSGGSVGPAATAATSLEDRSGDVSGVGAPAYADLIGATVTRTGSAYRVRIDVAASLPARQADDRTMNAACFIDTDGDGHVDYEMWATLADDGWSTSYRYPDGARFGSSSGVAVSVTGPTLVLGFPQDHVGGATSFRWATGTEYGTVEQVASGTTSQDLAPDAGAARFPA